MIKNPPGFFDLPGRACGQGRRPRREGYRPRQGLGTIVSGATADEQALVEVLAANGRCHIRILWPFLGASVVV